MRSASSEGKVVPFLQGIVRQNVNLAPFTTLGVGGFAEFFCEPRSVAELISLIRMASAAGVQVRLLGGGSNVLIRDGKLQGLVIRLSQPAFKEFTITGEIVIAAAGAPLGQIVTSTVCSGLSGLESLIGIPGTLGGAVRGNAGGRAGDIAQWIIMVRGLDAQGNETDLKGDQLRFGYRSSNLKPLFITEINLKLCPDTGDLAVKRMRGILDEKRKSQPVKLQSAGCIFKNSRNISSRVLIAGCNLAGKQVGGAIVSPLHPNFIITAPGTKADDVVSLIDLIRESVLKRMNIDLELEIEVW